MRPVKAGRRSRTRRIVGGALLAVVGLYGLLLIPGPSPSLSEGAGKEPFAWNRQAFWSALEAQFRDARAHGCERLGPVIRDSLEQFDDNLERLGSTDLPPSSPSFDALESSCFRLALMAAACPEWLEECVGAYARMRDWVKRQSEHWPMDAREARERLYALLYGGRAAIEEAMLQAPRDSLPPVLEGSGEAAGGPAATVRGITIASGDILVSRGGAATSALIARGNDFPGNFSHVALAHVDAGTHQVSMIESHIERGVTVSPIEAYLSDTKLRVMVLRLHADLPQLVADPLLPHRAASLALRNASARHIPYDFTMNYRDTSRQFCSEVASAAYQPFGVTLWMGLSHLSAPGVTSWLAALGVRHFETQEPSDLEYDPQLRVVAEWRDPDTLFGDHADNAVIDVMLEAAEAGERLGYDWYLLPPARLAKGYSVVKNWFGAVGPMPEGMSAVTALRVKRLTGTHAAIKARLLQKVEAFELERGYVPPYWELVRMAREART